MKSATAELIIVPTGSAMWRPQLDDELYLPDFLKHRWGRREGRAAWGAAKVSQKVVRAQLRPLVEMLITNDRP